MCLGVAAGLALLTWFIVLPAVFAVQITLNDQQLTFNGSGWQETQSPQICQQVSPTMRRTNTSGDTVDFTFSGTGVIIWGPVAGDSLPVVVVLDGVTQPLAAPQECTGGCGIIYAHGDLTAASHNITVLFPQPNGTSTLSVCGITVTTYFPQFVRPPSPTTIVTSNATAMMVPTSSATLEPSPPPVGTTAFVTTRGMIITIIGAIFGAIAGMFLLLFVFISVRGRITRYAARSKDRENSSDREARDHDLKHTLSTLSSVYSSDGKSSVTNPLECPTVRAPMTVSVTSTHSPLYFCTSSGSGLNQTLPSRMPSIYTELSTVQNFGLYPGTPIETENVYVYSSHTEKNPLVSYVPSGASSRLSIPIALFSPHRRSSSTNPLVSQTFIPARNSHISDDFNLFVTPRASSIRIIPRKDIRNEQKRKSSTRSHSSRILDTPVRLSSII